MLKTSKLWNWFSKTAPYFIGFGVGAGLSFIITAIPVIKELSIPLLVLVVLGIVALSVAVSAFILVYYIPNRNAKKLYEKFVRDKMLQMVGESQGAKTKEELKALEFGMREEYKRQQAEKERQKMSLKESRKNSSGSKAFGN